MTKEIYKTEDNEHYHITYPVEVKDFIFASMEFAIQKKNQYCKLVVK